MELRNYTNKLLTYLLPWRHNMTTATTAARTPNYSDSTVATMIGQYTANPTRDTVNELARQFNKNPRSIIAKLVREGIYQAAPRVTKTGAPIVRKAAIIADITAELGLANNSLASLEKTSKADLQKLLEAINLRVVA